MEDLEDTLEEEEVDEEGSDPAEDDEAPATASAPAPRAGDEDVESIQDILVKQEARDDEADDDDDEAAVALTKDERLEPTETRVVPMQATEFVCKRCYLVKHRSQLADKKRTLCRDCA